MSAQAKISLCNNVSCNEQANAIRLRNTMRKLPQHLLETHRFVLAVIQLAS